MNEKLNNSVLSINTIPFAVCHIDFSGIILTCNDSTEKITGYLLSELEGQIIEIILPDFFKGSHVKKYKALANAKAASLICKSKQLLNSIINVTEVDNGYMVFITDVESKNSTLNGIPNNVTSPSSLAIKLMDSIEEAFWEWNIEDGNVYYSAQMMAILGYKAEALSGSISIWDQLVNNQDLQNFHSQVISHFKGKLSCIHPILSIKTEDGITKWFSVFGKIIEYKNDRAYKMFGTVKDITEHHLLVEQLRERNNF